MRFRYRLFLALLAVFLAAVDAAAFLLISQSFSLSLEREKTRALGEAKIIAQGVSTAVKGVDRGRLDDAMARYFSYYETQGVSLALIADGEIAASNIGGDRALALVPQDAQRKWLLDTSAQPHRLLVGDALGDGLSLVYARDVGDLYRMRERLTLLFVGVNIGAAILLAAAALLIARLLLRPLEKLDLAAKRLAQGEYGVALPTEGNDEIGALARSFSSMSQAVAEREEELAAQAKRKQEFIDSLSHEMRTPLTSVTGFARVLQTANADPAQRERALSHIVAEAKRLQDMADKLLALTLLDHRGIDRAPIDAEAFLQDVAQGLSPLLEERGVSLRVQCGCTGLCGDASLLSLAARNLVINAANASRSGDEIALSLCGDPPVLEVADRGCGMNDEQRERAFEPFWRADKSRSRKAGGAGLGLSLCRRIADAHGATLTLHARPGGGTLARMEFCASGGVYDLVTSP